jgi:uncharacterized repeat protein (TIGR01451 family)
MAAVSLFVVAFGVYVADAAVLLAAIVPAAYAAYPSLVQPASPPLSVERAVEDRTPAAGETVSVTLRVRNEGATPLAAVTVADDPPGGLGVDGDTRVASPLAPGESATVEYEVAARHGVHEWGAPSVNIRDRSGGHEAEHSSSGTGDDRIECRPTVSDVRPGADIVSSGRRAGGRGAGVEFEHVREYRSGDAPARVDWRRFAATGDLRTVVSPAPQSGSLVVCVDARKAAFRVRGDSRPTAVAHAATAGRAVAVAAAERGVRVGAAAFGTRFDWAAPAGGRFEGTAAASVLDDRVADWRPSADAEDHGDWRQSLSSLLPPDADVVLCTPLVDGVTEGFARRLAADRRVVVVSPDVTRSDSSGTRVAALERRQRIRSLRNAGVRVVDWRPPASLAAAVERSQPGGESQ